MAYRQVQLPRLAIDRMSVKYGAFESLLSRCAPLTDDQLCSSENCGLNTRPFLFSIHVIRYLAVYLVCIAYTCTCIIILVRVCNE